MKTADGLLTVFKLEEEAEEAKPVTVKPIKASTAVAAFGGPGTYELRLKRTRDNVDEFLVHQEEVKGKHWAIDTSERNWVAPKDVQRTTGTRRDEPGHGRPGKGGRCELDGRHALVGHPGRTTHASPPQRMPFSGSMIANALAEVGTFEKGNFREQQRIVSYWTGTALADHANREYASGALHAVERRLSCLDHPASRRGGAAPISPMIRAWQNWGEAVAADAASAGMVAVAALREVAILPALSFDACRTASKSSGVTSLIGLRSSAWRQRM